MSKTPGMKISEARVAKRKKIARLTSKKCTRERFKRI